MDKKELDSFSKDPAGSGHDEEKLELTRSEIIELIEASQIEVVQELKTSEQFSGPVPHPKHMQQYKTIDKTLPHRFTKMAEDNLRHRQFVEKYAIVTDSVLAMLGWATPTAISFFVLYSAVGFIRDGKSIEALVSLVAALATLGGAFYLKNFASKQGQEDE